ncbi:MAG: glycoside hydrolase family 15 protein [Dysgonamonadaceae bacterium]|jgi:GH15 family glucan-1,4-alpha-glucosidase|nr:glycoside hydrolase family 15 protein [Dysgonamonadaceae bacterium]MDD3356043.1 glycoside hydrolase family 15 protein [Dysgonamonadaceae bacterium]MDD4246226.1 glycoside hydrolase family 15 protein [Dysgonamonadaceae bacterium]MDD4604993.1 glycoside hydrolase family 15 protein [Dysgonamonadaceae bacterium]HUI32220.1 glycoside hydrolase family 15 protein [Dysgonamonadaceae bacterium]
MENLNYGVIGNCRSAALISKEGSIDWFCFPDFDSPSIFSRLLDKEKGGHFAFVVSDDYEISQKYVGHTNILMTTYEAEEGAFLVFDYMPHYTTTENKSYLPPEIHRYMRVMRGKPRLRIEYQPRMNYASEDVEHLRFDEYIKTFSKENEDDKIYLYTSVDFDTFLNGDEFVLENHQFFLLSYNQKLVNINLNEIHLNYERTKVYWMNWSNRSRQFNEYNDIIMRSMLVLKLMSYQYSGAMLAALTTSLPESIGEVRNWDYRFCWVRDASMTIDTLFYLKHRNTAQRFIEFITRILKSRDDSFQIMYGIRGEKVLTEEILPHLSGYENSAPVRIGNAAYTQKQNDSIGYLLDVIYQYYMYAPGTLDEVEEIWEIVKNLVRMVLRDWSKPDQSIWEFRTISRHFVFSKVMSWVAIDRASKIAALLQKDSYANAWEGVAAEIKEDIITHGWKEEIQCFSQAYDNLDYDSSVLLMQTYGFIEATDERYIKTVKTIKENLLYNGLMYRYKSKDDFGKPTSAFTICTFWLIEALYAIGERDEAKEIFDEMLKNVNHVGLLSEDLDFETKRRLGNFPQAYSHLALINTASLFVEEKTLSQFIRA